MKIAVRLDDITPDMDWEKFEAFKEILDTYGIQPLIGVVPDNRDENLACSTPRADFWEYIKDLQSQGWIVAMHGVYHVYDSKQGGMFPLNHFSEFAGHSLEIQKEKIGIGKELLQKHGIHTDFFMTPAHTYDSNTLKALKEHGFKRITDGFGTKPYEYRGMTFYPISFRMADSLKKEKGYTTMVVHTNTIEDMEYYRNIFAQHREKFISYREYMDIPAVRCKAYSRWKEYAMAVLKHWLVKLK